MNDSEKTIADLKAQIATLLESTVKLHGKVDKILNEISTGESTKIGVLVSRLK